MMAAFMLDAMPVNAAFQSTLSNNIVAQHLELSFGVRFRIMDDSIFYELKVISIATGTSFKASLELSFSKIMHAHMLHRLLETSAQPNTCNFFLGLLIHRICRLLSTYEGGRVGRRLARDPRFKRRTFAAHISNMEFSSTSRHSKSV
ncbi:uncharacterized protein TNCV_1009931 [Trichonephila clavipes]|nr:uncharacterized protein TNCV_1009931 [Trichonephila clavipes]